MGPANLAQDLRLAQNQRVEAGGDAQEVADGLELGEGVGVARVCGQVYLLGRGDEAANVHLGGPVVGREAVELRPIAGGEQDRLRQHPFAPCARERGLDLVLLEGHALAHLEGRRAVVEPYDDEVHY